MSRGYELDERDDQGGQAPEASQPTGGPRQIEGRVSGGGGSPRNRQRQRSTDSDDRFPDTRATGRREVRALGRRYELSVRERDALRDIGRFRTIATDDLLKHRYGGMASSMRQVLTRLQQLGLLKRRSISVGKHRDTLTVVALTEQGAGLVRQDEQLPEDQAVYAGFVKPAEVPHDAAIYAMYRAEAAQIEGRGAKVRRVVLDYELKKDIYSRLGRNRDAGALEHARRQKELAAEHHLPIVDGKIALPDLRIEYETPEGDLERVDLELATEHYHRGHMESKARAGFKLYGFVSTSRGRRAQWEGRELTASVLSL